MCVFTLRGFNYIFALNTCYHVKLKAIQTSRKYGRKKGTVVLNLIVEQKVINKFWSRLPVFHVSSFPGGQCWQCCCWPKTNF